MPTERKTVDQLDALLKERTAELEEIQKEMAGLIYSISHDVRAPLRSITGFSEALIEDYRDKLDEQGIDYVNRILSAAERMELLIKKLVELAQISREELHSERVDLSALAESIAAELKAADPQRSVQFSIEKGLMVSGDPRLLKIALQQLLENAWKFTGKHPTARIELGSERRNDHRLVYVRDDGAGFDAAFADKMFSPFQRFHPAREFEGIGIGLAMVQRILHRHHGKVWAVGKVEEGTTVYMEME